MGKERKNTAMRRENKVRKNKNKKSGIGLENQDKREKDRARDGMTEEGEEKDDRK